jgi:hypothetical protein
MRINRKTYTIKKKRFLGYLSETCNVTRSCRLAGVDRSDMYKLRKDDPYFAEDWATAIEMGIEALEDEMHRRAFEGVLITNQHGTNRKYSDVLAIFLLKAHRPDKYSDRFRLVIPPAERGTLGLDDPRLTDKMDSILKSLMASAQNLPSHTVSTEMQ